MINTLRNASVFVISYLAPISAIAHVIMIFIALDFISGCWAAIKLKEKIESKKMRNTVTKVVWYIIALIMAHMMETTFNLQWSHFAQLVGGFICMVEVKSVFENITKITNEPIFKRIYRLFEKKATDTLNLNNQNDDSTPKNL